MYIYTYTYIYGTGILVESVYSLAVDILKSQFDCI